MNVTSDDSTDGLTEGVGQELVPAGAQGNSPLKVQDGQWTFRFNYVDPTKVSQLILISINISSLRDCQILEKAANKVQ